MIEMLLTGSAVRTAANEPTGLSVVRQQIHRIRMKIVKKRNQITAHIFVTIG